MSKKEVRYDKGVITFEGGKEVEVLVKTVPLKDGKELRVLIMGGCKSMWR